MTKQQMKKYVLKLYKYKKISDYQFRNAIGNLEQLRDSDLLWEDYILLLEMLKTLSFI